MTNRLGLFLLGWVLVLGGGWFAHGVQTADGVRVEDVRYPGGGGITLSGLLYIPASATVQRPAPAVLVSHGFINTREMQSPFAIELSRRGFVVLAMDMTGHGYSGGVLGEQGFGGPGALTYLRSLPFVDKSNIGLEGHSMGGSPVMNAAASQPDGYRSVVLEGSTTGFMGAAPGTPTTPRNLEVVFGQYDEFADTMWQVKKGSQVGSAPRLMALFGTADPVVPGRLYGSIEAGTARMLINPAIDHPQEHFTAAGVGAAIDWFQATLKGAAAPKPASDQVWLNKEFGTLAGFIGCVVLILGTFRLILPASMDNAPQPASKARDGRWWLSFLLTAALPAATYYPFMKLAPVLFFAPFALVGAVPFAMRTFSEQITNQLLVWAVLNGLISLLLSFVLRGGKTVFTRRWISAAVVAAISVGAGYLSLVIVDRLFKVDYRFWVLGLKPFDRRHVHLFLVYLAPFTVFFLCALRGFATSLPIRKEGPAAAYAYGAAAMSLGFVAMLAAQYITMAATGLLIDPSQALNTIIAFQFVPILAVVGLIAAFTYRATNDYVPGAFICALFVTWYIVAGTAVFPPTLGLGPPPAAHAAASAARP
jgi:pimeloyl-ACP methyl ester carboxylesterase